MGALKAKRLLLRNVLFVIWPLSYLPLYAMPPEPLDGPTPLPAGVTIERHLATDDIHLYRAALQAGAWRLLVTQHGIDTAVELTLPDGNRLGPFSSPVGRRGTEAVLVTVEAPGTLEIFLRARWSSSGRYTVTLERLAAATTAQRTPPEQALVLAEAAATTAARSYAEGSKEAAREGYARALASWPSTDPAGTARTLVALANLARFRNEPGEAASLLRRALPIWRTLGDRENEAATLNRLGLTFDKLGESATARGLFEEAVTLWQEQEDRRGEASARINFCLALQRQGAFLDARTCYQRTRTLFRALHETDRETAVLNNLAGVHWRLGEPDRALALYDEVLARNRNTEETIKTARTLSNRALLYYDLGEAEKALLDFGRALDIFRQREDRRMEGAMLSNLGKTHLGLGEFERARMFLEQALPLRRAASDRRGEASTLRSLGQAYVRLEDWRKAFDAFAAALALSRELSDRRGEATVLQIIGEAHVEQKSLRRAIVELEQAAALQRELDDRHQEAQALLALGEAHRLLEDPEQALVLIDRALEIFRTVRAPGDEVRALEANARAERDLGRTAEALAATTTAITLLEDLRVRVGGLRQRASLIATRRSIYGLHIDLLMKRHRLEPETGHDRQAFAASERARSQTLLDVIHTERVLDEDLRQRLQVATRRLAARTERQVALLGQQHGEAARLAADREVLAALSDLERVRAEARQQDPGYNTLVNDKVLRAAQAGDLLDPGTLLLEYILGPERSFLWAVTPDSFSSFELPPQGQIEALARRAHSNMSTLDLRTGRTHRGALIELGGVLLAPVAEHLAAAGRLAVVADGALHYVPFAALPAPGSSQPLVVRHEVVHLPSATALAAQRRRRSTATAPKTIAVLADPVFDRLDPRLANVELAPEGVAQPPAVPTRVRGALGNLGRLQATGHEAAAIAALVEPGERLLALGLDAHRERVLGGELAAYRYLHFATHGRMNSRHPELSGLVLSLLDAEGRPRNGFLSMEDILGLELRAEVVVLSGCQTALGREIRGEGLLGPTRGFMAAGVPRVVASLWPVRDQVTAALMTHFYRGMLEEGQPPAVALAAAQRSVRRERRWADPYFWSAFILLGDWRSSGNSNAP